MTACAQRESEQKWGLQQAQSRIHRLYKSNLPSGVNLNTYRNHTARPILQASSSCQAISQKATYKTTKAIAIAATSSSRSSLLHSKMSTTAIAVFVPGYALLPQKSNIIDSIRIQNCPFVVVFTAPAARLTAGPRIAQLSSLSLY